MPLSFPATLSYHTSMTTPSKPPAGFFSTPFGKGVAGIVAAILIAVGGKLVWDLIVGNPVSPDIKVVAFTQNPQSYEGRYPAATVTVENQGQKTAVDCLITWRPGISFKSGGSVQVNSAQFAVDGGQQYTANLTSPTAYEFLGSTTAQASVQCNNTSDPGQQETVKVGY